MGIVKPRGNHPGQPLEQQRTGIGIALAKGMQRRAGNAQHPALAESQRAGRVHTPPQRRRPAKYPTGLDPRYRKRRAIIRLEADYHLTFYQHGEVRGRLALVEDGGPRWEAAVEKQAVKYTELIGR